MKKILVASCFYELPIKIERHLNKMGLSVELTVVQSADEVLQALSEIHYDGLFSEYAINDIDIWKLSTLVQSSRFNDYAIPLYLIQESCETEIPLILSNEYQFNVIVLEQLVEVSVDSFPGETFLGQVVWISDKAEFTPKNVQTKEERVNTVFAVKVRIPNPDHKLKPGLPADAVLVIQYCPPLVLGRIAHKLC